VDNKLGIAGSNLVAIVDQGLRDPLPVQQGPVGTLEVAQLTLGTYQQQAKMRARHPGIQDAEVGVFTPPDAEALPRTEGDLLSGRTPGLDFKDYWHR